MLLKRNQGGGISFDNKIEKVDEMEFCFTAYEVESYDTIFETDAIVVFAK